MQQAYVLDDHAAIHGLAHVVDGEGGNRGRGEGFHFNTGYTLESTGGGDVYAAVFAIQRDIDIDAREQ